MASFEELIQLNKDGHLSNFLAHRFNGEIGHTSPTKDSDVIIAFESTEKTPYGQDIETAIKEHYSRLGYTLEIIGIITKYSLGAFLYFKDKKIGNIIITITTHYPLFASKDSHCHLRLTTMVW
jgi:hypothetical protein